MAIRGIVFVVSCILLSCGSNVNTAKYRAALKKKSKLRKLFLEKFRDKGYDSTEINTRLPAFKKVVELVVDNNDNEAIGWESDINFLADKTEEELKKWLMTITWDTTENKYTHQKIEIYANDDDDGINWIDKGVVSPIAKDQTEDCRACWAFAAVVVIDGRYQIVTNTSINFSEQELVDCVYFIKGRHQDGCYGGQMTDVYDYVKSYGRLSTETSAPYVHDDQGKCDYDDIKNGLKDAHITKWAILHPSDKQHIDALRDGPISVAVQTTQNFLFYRSGVLRDDSCKNLIPNHAVAMVGYDKESYIIKNSWGPGWGDNGFMRSARGHHGCGLVYYSIVPTFVKGKPDTKPLPGPPDDCRDEWGKDFCANYLQYCQYYKSYCAKSCNAC